MDILDTIDNASLPKVKRSASSSRSGMGHTALSWLLAWEVYPIILLAAVFSANPFAGVIVTGILNVLAVLFTYIVVRRYYGRFAGTVAGLFYAVAQLAVFYSGFLWNQNLLAPFVPLFLFALLWGVIERRRGWLVPAVVLWGWVVQFDGSALLLIIPLGLACILAFKTLRWRDVFLAVALLALIY